MRRKGKGRAGAATARVIDCIDKVGRLRGGTQDLGATGLTCAFVRVLAYEIRPTIRPMHEEKARCGVSVYRIGFVLDAAERVVLAAAGEREQEE